MVHDFFLYLFLQIGSPYRAIPGILNCFFFSAFGLPAFPTFGLNPIFADYHPD